jgi:hypothetical protein
MGSGKGKSKRVQALTTEVKAKDEVVHIPRKWREFLRESGLSSTKLYRYYLGRSSTPELSQAEYLKLLNELFADAVETGVLILPGQRVKEDFIISVEPPDLGSGFIAKITAKNRPSHGASFEGTTLLSQDVDLGDRCVHHALSSIAQGVYSSLHY